MGVVFVCPPRRSWSITFFHSRSASESCIQILPHKFHALTSSCTSRSITQDTWWLFWTVSHTSRGYIVNRYPTIAAALLPSLRMDRVPCLEGRISGTTMPTALDRFRVHERAGFNLKRLEDSSWGNLPRSLSASFRPFDIPVYMYRRVPIKLRE